MLSINARGDAHQRGQQHGQQSAELIAKILARYKSKGLLGALYLPALRKLEQVFPELVSEMEGIAEGAGLPKDQIFQMNLQQLPLAPMCSIVGALDDEGAAWIAKTDDIAEDELGFNVLTHHSPLSAPNCLCLHFAGTIWSSTTMNEAGFCMAMTGLPGEKGPSEGVPAMAFLHILPFRCTTVSEAVALLEQFQLDGCGISLLLSDASHNLVLLEKNCKGQFSRTFKKGDDAFCHTNHACCGILSDPPESAHTTLGINSRARLENLQTRAKNGHPSCENFQKLLLDHKEPGGVCQHGGGGLHTDYAVILSPSQGGFWRTSGPPCQSDFAFVSFPKKT